MPINIDSRRYHDLWSLVIYLLLTLGLLYLMVLSARTADPAKEVGRVIEKLNTQQAIIYVDASEDSYKQLREFTPYTNLLTIVHCDEQSTLCQEQQIEEVPTIVLTNLGIDLVGVQTIEQLDSLFNQIGI